MSFSIVVFGELKRKYIFHRKLLFGDAKCRHAESIHDSKHNMAPKHLDKNVIRMSQLRVMC